MYKENMIYVRNAQQVCSFEAQTLMCMHDSCILFATAC